MHLSNNVTIFAMVLYSILTYFVGPLVTRPFLGTSSENCIVGFSLGFAVSVFLWAKFGKNLAG